MKHIFENAVKWYFTSCAKVYEINYPGIAGYMADGRHAR